jgi:hypothetical protein
MNLLIPNCASSPTPFRVEHKLVGAESTKLSMSECDLLTGSEVLKKQQCACACACVYAHVHAHTHRHICVYVREKS